MILDNPWIHALLIGGLLMAFTLSVAGFGVFIERRFAGWLQLRYGPRWVGPQGILQIVADALKMFQKEDIVPRQADKVLFNLAPIFPMFFTILLLAVIPLGATVGEDGRWLASYAIAPLDIGILWPLGIAGLMVFPLWAAGWASNNKWALLSGMRMVAQGISYEVPLVLAVLVPVILTGSLNMSDIVSEQAHHGWFISRGAGVGLVAMVLFFFTSLAEADRIPFDLPEAESELVAGITTEYSGIKMGLFVINEYVHTLVSSFLLVTLFLGGPHMPLGLDLWTTAAGPFVGAFWLILKTLLLFGFIYWARWSWLRFRSDQLMDLAWQRLVPLGLVLVMWAAVWTFLLPRGMWAALLGGAA